MVLMKCGRHWLPSNKRFHPTPLRGHKIVPILGSGFGETVTSIYRCGAGEAQGVGWQPYDPTLY